MDGSVRLSIYHNIPEGWGGGQVTLDIRGGLIEDYLAMVMPASVTIGDFYLYSLRLQPGLVGTIPMGDRFEMTGAVRAHVYVRVMELNAVGYNLGFGITTPSGEWTLRPEAGWLRMTGADSDKTYFQYGVGIEHNLVLGEKKDGIRQDN